VVLNGFCTLITRLTLRRTTQPPQTLMGDKADRHGYPTSIPSEITILTLVSFITSDLKRSLTSFHDSTDHAVSWVMAIKSIVVGE